MFGCEFGSMIFDGGCGYEGPARWIGRRVLGCRTPTHGDSPLQRGCPIPRRGTSPSPRVVFDRPTSPVTAPGRPPGFRPRTPIRGRLCAGITMALRRPHKRMKIATRVSRS